MQRSLASLAFLLLVTMLVACGGGAAASPGGGAAASPGGDAGAGATDAPTVTVAPGATATPVATEPGSAGGPAGAVCDLATLDELEEVFGMAVTATTLAGPPDVCMIENEAGHVLVSWNVNRTDAAMIYAALTEIATEVPGIGDKAAFVENTGLLILKGDALANVVISGQADLSEEDGQAAAKAVAALIAGRM